MSRKNLFLICLDGATWKLLNPWIKEKALPTFKKLKEEAVFGILKSTIPPATSPAIPSLYTGKNPGKHGLIGFIGEKGEVLSSHKLQAKAIWELLSEFGLKSCVINVPTTYPPKKINGIIITGFLTPSKNTDFIYPSEFKKDFSDFPLAVEFEFGLEESQLSPQVILKKQTDVTLKRFEILKRILTKDNFDFVMFFVKGTDILQHLFWEQRDILLNYYKKIDEMLNFFLIKFPSSYLVVVSDHGFEKAPEKVFYINTWLHKQDLLYFKSELIQKAFTQSFYLVKQSKKLKNFIRRLIPQSQTKKLKTANIDWDKTIAYAKPGIDFGIYINRKGLSSDKYYQVRSRIISLLKSLCDGNKKIIKEVYTRETIFKGEKLEELPDIVFLSEDNYRPTSEIVLQPEFIAFDSKRKKVASHHADRDGIIFFFGPEIKSNYNLEASILDITPTVLHILRVPIPADIDGKVLKEIFNENSSLAKEKIRIFHPGKNQKIKKIIKKLKKSGKI